MTGCCALVLQAVFLAISYIVLWAPWRSHRSLVAQPALPGATPPPAPVLQSDLSVRHDPESRLVAPHTSASDSADVSLDLTLDAPPPRPSAMRAALSPAAAREFEVIHAACAAHAIPLGSDLRAETRLRAQLLAPPAPDRRKLSELKARANAIVVARKSGIRRSQVAAAVKR
jgi:hypothetical protein